MTASPQDQRLTTARGLLQRLRRELRAASAVSLLDEALACLAEAAEPPPSLGDPAAADLVEANKQLRALLDSTLVGIYQTTRDGRVLYANEALARILGYPSVHAFMAMNMADTYTDPAERDAFIATLESAEGQVVNYELTRCTPAGSRKQILTSASLDGDTLTGVVVDITERKLAEEALKEREVQYRRVVETAAEGIWVLDAEHRTTFVNRAMTEMLGYAAEEMLGQPLLAFVMPADRDKVTEAMGRRMQGTAERLERRFRRKDGGELIAMVNATPMRDGSGRFLGSFGMVTDITARIAAEEALRARARQLETVRVVAEEITRELGLHRLLDLITRRTIELVGADSGGVHLWDEAAQALIPQVTAGMTLAPWQAEIRYRLGEGVVGAVAARREGMIVNDYRAWAGAHPAFLARTNVGAVLAEPLMYQGQLLGVIAVTRPAGRPFAEDDQYLLRLFASQAAAAITNARLFQEERRRRGQLEALREVGSEITRELDLDRLLTAILERAMELVGSSTGIIALWDDERHAVVPRVLLGDLAAVPRSPISLGEGIIGRVAQSRHGLIVNDYRAWAGARAAVLASTVVAAGLAEPLLYRDTLIGVVNLGRGTDQPGFTDQDSQLLRLFADQAAIAIENARLFREEQRRREQLEAVRLVSAEIARELDLDRLLDLILRHALGLAEAEAGVILLWDGKKQELFPRVRTEEFFTDVPKRAIPLGEGVVGRVAATRVGLIVNDYRTWAGARPEILTRTSIAASLAEPLLYRNQLIGVINLSNTAQRGAFTEQHGALLRLFADQAAIAVQNAQLYHAMHQAIQDLRRAQDELLHSQKLRALGQLAAGIAHDLNNMLAAVLGQIELLKIRVAYPEVREALATLETAATDGAEIVRRIQDFARQRASSHLTSCNLEAIVAEAGEITRPRWKDEADRRGVAIALRASLERLPQILGNPAEIREALTNLIFNAVDAMPAGGEIEILGTADEETVLLSIRDTGTGMPEEVRSRVFEPFFTTKGVRGTGLGLSLVYGIMERHGGRVDAQSSPGRGSTFTLQFQRAHEAGGPMRPAAAASLPAPRRILLVDDDAMVRRTMAALLQAVGQQVTEVDGGAAALAELATGPYDLVFTDLGMPEMTGRQLAEAIKARHPALPVVLITGWQDQVGADAEQRRFVDALLPKPSRLEDLLRVIRELGASPNR